MAWDDAKREKAVNSYQEANPTAETSIEIIEQIAEDLGETPNGVRMILTKAGVYIKKDGIKSTPTSEGSKEKVTGKTRVSKEDSIKTLKDVLEETGFTPNDEICDKLTGKAAVYFAGVVGELKTKLGM